MPNTDSPNGFSKFEGIGGSLSTKSRQYAVSDSYTTPLGEGQLVILTGGFVQSYTAASQNILGVAAHFVSSTGTGRLVLVNDDPEQVFVAQTDDNTITTTEGFRGNIFGVTLGPVNSVTRRSTQEIDTNVNGAASTTNTLQCVDVFGGIGNTVNTSWTRLAVKIVPQNHVYGADAPPDAAA